MNPFLHLNFNEPVLKDTFVLPPIDETEPGYWKYYQKIPINDVLRPEMIARFLHMGLLPRPGCLLFYAPPGAKLKLHKDAGGLDAWAINWALTPNPAGMIWYKTDAEGEQKIAYESTTPTPFTSYRDDEVTEICREEIGFPTIVRIGIPHGGFNNSDQGAWLLSVRFMSPMTWNQANMIFKQYVVS